MNKPKKPAEDNSKAGAVTNSIADEVDEILQTDDNLMDTSKPMDDAFLMSRSKLKHKLLTLIADRERKARVNELESLKAMVAPNQSPFGNMYLYDYAANRISALRKVNEESALQSSSTMPGMSTETREIINNGRLIIFRQEDNQIVSMQGELPNGKIGYWIDEERPFIDEELANIPLLEKHLKDLAERVDLEMTPTPKAEDKES